MNFRLPLWWLKLTNEARENVTNVTGAGVGGGRKVNLSLVDDRLTMFQVGTTLRANRSLRAATRGERVGIRERERGEFLVDRRQGGSVSGLYEHGGQPMAFNGVQRRMGKSASGDGQRRWWRMRVVQYLVGVSVCSDNDGGFVLSDNDGGGGLL